MSWVKVFAGVSVAVTLLVALTAADPEVRLDRWEDEAFHQQRISSIERRIMEIAALVQRDSKTIGADKKKCDTCKPIVTYLWETIQNGGAGMDLLEFALNATCASKLKDHPDLVPICEDVATDLLKAVHHGLASIAGLHFNWTMLACTDILQYCTVDCCQGSDLPEQLHIGYADNGNAVGASTMQVTFITRHKPSMPYVQYYGTGSNSTNMTATGVSRTYTVAGWLGWISGVVMSGLEADTEYWYRVGSSSNGPWSEWHNFKTLPLNAGTSARPLRVVTFADMGTGGEHYATVAALKTMVEHDQIDLIVHSGDISYSDGDSYRWDRFMREMQPIVSRVPYMTCPGNHELLWNFTAYKQRFFTPLPGYGAPSDAMYYSFSVGPIRFMMMDTETPWDTPRMDDVQVAWAEKVLTEANAQNQLIFVGFHRPLYCSNNGHDCHVYAPWLRSKIEPTLLRHDVAMVQTGHVHDYERTFPMFNGSAVAYNYENTTAPVSWVNGAPGCEEGLSSFPSAAPPAWSGSRQGANVGFLSLIMTNDANGKKIQAEFILSKDMAVFDNITITKP